MSNNLFSYLKKNYIMKMKFQIINIKTKIVNRSYFIHSYLLKKVTSIFRYNEKFSRNLKSEIDNSHFSISDNYREIRMPSYDFLGCSNVTYENSEY